MRGSSFGVVIGAVLAGCGALPDGAPGDEAARDERPFSSHQATLTIFEFDGELVAPKTTNPTKYVKDQLLYMVGQLNAHHSVARLDKVVLTNVEKSDNGDGRIRIDYHAALPVGWGSKTDVPTSFDLVLPRRITPIGIQTFADTYEATCVEAGGHDVNAGNFWYHYRPQVSGCVLDPAHVVARTASVTVSPANTTGKYPEYHKVWEDDALRVLAVFGKYADGAVDPSDPGIQAYDEFLAHVQTDLGPSFTTSPASVAEAPGVAQPDVTFTGTYEGRLVSITALLIDSPKVPNKTFDARYAALSQRADLIAYNGHAGLGANVRALAEKGKFLPGQYQLFFLNGCDTFAYLDDRLVTRRAAVNPDDPTGTKYMEVVTNLMPAYFSSMPSASMAVIEGLMRHDAPSSYEAIFAAIDESQVVAVTGEEDNVFDPGEAAPWTGLSEKGALGRGDSVRFETPVLEPGEYVIATDEDPAQQGGDVDLYVGLGFAPTLEAWDYSPYLYGSAEEVRFTLTEPTKVHLMVPGYEESPQAISYFVLGAARDE